MSTPVDPYAVPDELATRFLEVKAMAEALTGPEAAQFFVMLTSYSLHGMAYGATALTVSRTATPNLVQTQTGFTCDASFSPDLLAPATLRAARIEGDLATVALEARLEDIIQILRLG
ncbi:hypothetical protein [Angustibacter luteus]|uniref:SCP2 domain-containing protein n=1 Tax=Angustibacter luteus TaxID=658456 RepID=A0ABW1JF68_9ACTN